MLPTSLGDLEPVVDEREVDEETGNDEEDCVEEGDPSGLDDWRHY